MYDFTDEKAAKKGRGKAKADTSPDLVVYNPNPYPVVITTKGQAVGGFDWARVSSTDRIAIRAVDAGLVLVPSDL